jgi:Tfp pilus assembly protein PilX
VKQSLDLQRRERGAVLPFAIVGMVVVGIVVLGGYLVHTQYEKTQRTHEAQETALVVARNVILTARAKGAYDANALAQIASGSYSVPAPSPAPTSSAASGLKRTAAATTAPTVRTTVTTSGGVKYIDVVVFVPVAGAAPAVVEQKAPLVTLAPPAGSMQMR